MQQAEQWIKFPCMKCNWLLRVTTATKGKKARCPGCGNIAVVPEGWLERWKQVREWQKARDNANRVRRKQRRQKEKQERRTAQQARQVQIYRIQSEKEMAAMKARTEAIRRRAEEDRRVAEQAAWAEAEHNRREEEIATERALVQLCVQHIAAVERGDVFDAETMVDLFHKDWLQVEKDTGLTPAQISAGVTAASPAVGIGAGWVSGNVWLGIVAGIAAAALAAPLAKGYARVQYEAWLHKWRSIFSRCSVEQLTAFDGRLKECYPLVWRSFCQRGTIGMGQLTSQD